jgi:hypothetical protein
MTRCVRDDEFSPRSREVPVADVDGDALLALCAQTVRKQRKVDRPVRAVDATFLYGRELVFVKGLGIVQQSTYESGLAVVHAPGSRKSQEFLIQVLLKEHLELIVYFYERRGSHQK